jgi:hypothetical protein
MSRRLGARFWSEVTLAALTAILSVVTLVSEEWVETLFGVDPDGASGALEWGIVALLLALCAIFSVMGRAEWKRSTAAVGLLDTDKLRKA